MTTPMATSAAAATRPRHPAIDLLARYRAILGAAWAHRAELAGPKRLADEAAFLPAALSLQDTPVHPAPRRFAFGIIALFTIALVWSIVGKVDIVAIAPGRIIVSERTKLIQPLEASVVRRVLVKDGDTVQAGQALVELDATIANAEKLSVQEQLNASQSEMLRTAALLQRLGQTAVPTPVHQIQGPPLPAAIHAQLQSEWMDIAAKLAKLDAEAARRSAEMATVQELIAKLQATVPMAQTREADFKRLVGEGFISSHATQDKTRDRVELERDLATQQAKRIEAQAALAETLQAKAAYRAETQRLLNDRNALATSKLQQLTQESSKAAQRERQTTLTAPVSGTVQQLAVHSIGGVVTPAQPLMVIVPDGAQGLDGKAGGGITAEVMIANQDIGFVQPGQMAEVKLETFPYTKYGTVKARVAIVTADAVGEDRRATDARGADGKASFGAGSGTASGAIGGGAVYPATLTLSQKDMLIDGKRVNLTPGMAVTAEIKTGQRRVIEYLLAPVQRAGSESLRER